MRVYRNTFKDRRGVTRKTRNWYVEFRDHEGIRRRIPAFTDKGSSEELGRKLERLAALRATREALPIDMAKWIEGLASGLRDTLAGLDLIDGRRLAATRSIVDLLEDFKATLRSRERTESWIDHVVFRARLTFEGAGFVKLSDIEPAAIERHLHALRSGDVQPTEGALGRRKAKKKDEPKPRVRLSARESNHRLQACCQFTRWAVATRLLSTDPLAALAPMNTALDPRHKRRALRPEDIRTLIVTASSGPVYRGVPGDVRAMVWRLAAQVGLRVGEIQALQVRHVDLAAAGGPTLTVSASISKNRTEARLPIPKDLARELAPWVRGKLPAAAVLPLPPSFMHKATLWLRFDLERAEIPYRDESDRVADVHSLRSSYVTQLVRSGANVKVIQRLARHQSPMMTIGVYTRLDERDEREAIDAIPSLDSDTPSTTRATGTDGGNVLGSCWAISPAATRTSTPLDAAGKAARGPAKAPEGQELVAVEGFEPPTRGL